MTNYPTRHRTDWLTSFLEFTENSEPPPTYRLWTALSVIAACLRRKVKLDLGMLTFYPNFYVVLVGPPGKARKGTALGYGKYFLRKLGISMTAETQTRESLIRTLAESIETTILDDNKVITHSSVTIFSGELTVFLGYQNMQLVSELTDWYDGYDKWTYRTKHQGSDEVQGLYVNLLGATTPELLQTHLPPSAIGGGLTSRIIFVYEEKKGKTIPLPCITEKEINLRNELLLDLEQIAALKGEFKMSEDFFMEYSKWYVASEGNPPFEHPHFAGYVERRPTHILKLCMLLSASRSNSLLLTKEDFIRARSILELTEKKMTRAFSGIGKDTAADTTHTIMRTIAEKGTVMFHELLSDNWYDVDKWKLEKIIETLVGMRFCKTMTTAEGMRIVYLDNKVLEKEKEDKDDKQKKADREKVIIEN